MSTTENQREQQSHSIKDFAKEALHDLTHFDSKLIATLKPLITKPGFLTVKAFSAEQKNYVKPLALFVFVNFIFFIFKSKGLFHYTLDAYSSIDFFKQTITKHIAASHLSPAIFAEQFNTSMKFEQQEYVIVMIPLFALFTYLLYLDKKIYYVEHLIFSLHIYSFAVIFLMLLPYAAIVVNYFVDLTGNHLRILNSEVTLDVILFSVMSWYLYDALKKVYKQKIFITILKTVLSVACFFSLIVFVYRFLLFYVVMHSVNE